MTRFLLDTNLLLALEPRRPFPPPALRAASSVATGLSVHLHGPSILALAEKNGCRLARGHATARASPCCASYRPHVPPPLTPAEPVGLGGITLG